MSSFSLSKRLVVSVLGALILIGAFFALNSYIYNVKQGGALDHKSATYVVQGTPITLVNGESEVVSGDANSSSRTVTRYFGNEAKGDLNDDGVPDIAFLLTQNGGGSGTFFYAVVAFQNAAGRYEGSNAILLGDRIAPQTTEIRNGILIVNYADRTPDEPMSASPSVGVSAFIYFDGERLLAVPPTGPISIEGKLVCLVPDSEATSPTAECAYGLQDEFDRFFALVDASSESGRFAKLLLNSRVHIDGIFKLQIGSLYRTVGQIEVGAITSVAAPI